MAYLTACRTACPTMCPGWKMAVSPTTNAAPLVQLVPNVGRPPEPQVPTVYPAPRLAPWVWKHAPVFDQLACHTLWKVPS